MEFFRCRPGVFIDEWFASTRMKPLQCFVDGSQASLICQNYQNLIKMEAVSWIQIADIFFVLQLSFNLRSVTLCKNK